MNIPGLDPELLALALKMGAAGLVVVLPLARFAYRVGYRAAVKAFKKAAADDGVEDFRDYVAKELPDEPPPLFGGK